MIQLMLKNLLRSGLVKYGFLFLLVAAIAGTLVGKQYLKKQEKSIAAASTYQKEQIRRNARAFKDELGYMLYYVKFGMVNQSLPVSSLAIGQRDITPSLISVTIRNLEAQKYDAEFVNPYNQMIGNIDFSFVLIYLFPLLIIAFTYNILSEEVESGTSKLLTVQSGRPLRFLLLSAGLRFTLISGFFVVLIASSAIILGIRFDYRLADYVLIGLSYIAVWFAICFMIISFKRAPTSMPWPCCSAICYCWLYCLALLIITWPVNILFRKRWRLQ